MATSYPGSIQRFQNTIPPTRATHPSESTWIMQVWDTLEAIQDELGNSPSGSYTTVRAWLSDLAGGNITNLNVSRLTGTRINTGTALLTIAQALNVIGNLEVSGTVTAVNYLRAGTGGGNPGFKLQRYGGKLDNSGWATVAHNLHDAGRRIMLVGFGYRGNSGEWVPITGQDMISIDGSNIYIKMGTAGQASSYGNRSWNGAILFAEAADTSW